MRKYLGILVAALFALAVFGGTPSHATSTCAASAVCVGQMTTFAAADGTTVKTLYTAPSGGNGVEINHIYCGSPTTRANSKILQIYILHSATAYPLFQASLNNVVGIPGSSQGSLPDILVTSSATVAPIGALSANSNGVTYFALSAGDSIQVGLNTALTGSDAIYCDVQAIQY